MDELDERLAQEHLDVFNKIGGKKLLDASFKHQLIFGQVITDPTHLLDTFSYVLTPEEYDEMSLFLKKDK